MNVPGHRLEASVLAAGAASAEVIALSEPLSFWGGFDIATGKVSDQQHPQKGATLKGKVLVMTSGRGSSSASSVLAEAIRVGTAPVGIVLREADPIIALGAIVAAELYGKQCPVVVVQAWDKLAASTRLSLSANAAEAAFVQIEAT